MADGNHPKSGDAHGSFVFVPHGDPDPVEWMREHPGWLRIPATMVVRGADQANPALQAEPAPIPSSRTVPASYEVRGPAPGLGPASSKPGETVPVPGEPPARSRRTPVRLPKVDRTGPDPIEAFRQADTILAAYKGPSAHGKAAPHDVTAPRAASAHPKAAPHHPAHDQVKPKPVSAEGVAELNDALKNPRIIAFLHLLGFEEQQGNTRDRYRIRYGDPTMRDPITDEDMRHCIAKNMGTTKKPHTAGGAYQVLASTYDEAQKRGLVSDFLPASQDRIAAEYHQRTACTKYMQDNDLDKAFNALNGRSTPLPGGREVYENTEQAKKDTNSI